MLVAGMGLIIPSIFYNSLSSNYGTIFLEDRALHISRITAIMLLIAFCVYLWFQIRSHHGLYEDILEADEKQDHDRHKDLLKAKLTFTEAVVGVVIGVTFVSFMAVFLVQQIEVSHSVHLLSRNRLLTYSSGSCTTGASATALWD
jgi:Ca2+:H+ antiporter